MRVSLPHKMKPDSYTESYAVNAADGWRERDSAEPDLLGKILDRDNLNRAYK